MKERTLQEILPAFPGKRVLIVGDVMLDEYIWGEVRRISPEAPVPVLEIHRRTYVPGGAGNTAANVVSLGGRALLGSVVGADRQAGRLREALKQAGVDVEGLLVDDGRPTTTKTRIVAYNQQIVRVDSEQRASLRVELADKLLRWVENRLTETDACILSDYDKGVVAEWLAERVIPMARDAGKPVIVDPKGTDYAKYRGATLVTPNVFEAGRALNRDVGGDADLLEVGRQLLEVLGDSAVLITRGAQGMSLFTSGGQAVHIPAVARHVFDVTGAGDTVTGTLAMAMAAGATLEEAAAMANRAAGIVVGKVGTATVSIEELMSGEPH